MTGPRGIGAMQAARTLACPRCGEGKLFEGFLTVAERCEVCDLDLRAADAGDGPAVFIIFVLGFLVVPGALLFEYWFSPAYWVHLVVWPVVITGLSIAMLRPSKAALIAIQYRHRSTEL